MTRPPRSVSFHGLRVERRYDPFDGDAFDVLFRPFAEGPSPSTSAGRGEVLIDAEIRDEPIALPSGLPPTFFLGHVQAYDAPDGCVLSDRFSRFDLRFDRHEVRMGICREGAVALPGVTQGMQHLALGLMLREFGLFGLHAAGVCIRDHAVLLVGDCRVGKTTTTLALAPHATGYLGDDRVLLREGGAGVELLSYPREFHVDATTAEAFGLGSRIDTTSRTVEGKHDIAPEAALRVPHQARFRGSLTLLFPTVGDGDVTFATSISRAEAFGLLLTASALTLVEGVRRRDDNLRVLERLANAGRVFEVSLGRDLLERPTEASGNLLRAVGVP